jgi:hypothetical protein
MDTTKQVQMLQMAYAGALADTVLQLSKEGVLPGVTARKRQEQLATGKLRVTQFGISNQEEVFLKLSELFGCAAWEITDRSEEVFLARNGNCKLCAIAKRIGAPSPCQLYCLDPMEGMVKALKPDAVYTIEETLWEGQKCRVKVDNSGH